MAKHMNIFLYIGKYVKQNSLDNSNAYSEQRGRRVAGHSPASLKIQTLILDAENAKIMILSYSQIENDILSTSNNVDLHIFCFSSLKL